MGECDCRSEMYGGGDCRCQCCLDSSDLKEALAAARAELERIRQEHADDLDTLAKMRERRAALEARLEAAGRLAVAAQAARSSTRDLTTAQQLGIALEKWRKA